MGYQEVLFDSILLLLPLSAGPSLEHYRTEYLQGTSEAWLKTGKSDLKTDKNIPQLYLVVTGLALNSG